MLALTDPVHKGLGDMHRALAVIDEFINHQSHSRYAKYNCKSLLTCTITLKYVTIRYSVEQANVFVVCLANIYHAFCPCLYMRKGVTKMHKK